MHGEYDVLWYYGFTEGSWNINHTDFLKKLSIVFHGILLLLEIKIVHGTQFRPSNSCKPPGGCLKARWRSSIPIKAKGVFVAMDCMDDLDECLKGDIQKGRNYLNLKHKSLQDMKHYR